MLNWKCLWLSFQKSGHLKHNWYAVIVGSLSNPTKSTLPRLYSFSWVRKLVWQSSLKFSSLWMICSIIFPHKQSTDHSNSFEMSWFTVSTFHISFQMLVWPDSYFVPFIILVLHSEVLLTITEHFLFCNQHCVWQTVTEVQTQDMHCKKKIAVNLCTRLEAKVIWCGLKWVTGRRRRGIFH